jgi:uncharacterized Tic20 family protein
LKEGGNVNEKAEAADVPTQDERIMAALAHVTVIWPTLGMIAPIVIWGTQREKSPFVRFQALQAAAYQFILILGGLVAGVCYVCSFFSIPLTAVFTIPFEEEAVGLCVPFFTFSCTFGLLFLLMLFWLAYIGYGIFGAVSALQGQDFRYVFLGSWLERYLEQA